MMPTVATSPMLKPRLLLIKSSAGGATKIAHQAGYYLLNGRWHSVKQDTPAPKGAPVAAHPHAAGKHEPAKHFTDEQWSQLKLPDTNSNAGTFNKQLDKLKEHSEAGHVTGILANGYGSNTYGKKLATIANHLLEKHGSEHKVEPGQKAGTHPAVQQAPAEKPAPKKAAPEVPAAKPASGGLTMPDFAEGKKATGVKDYYETIAQTIIDAANEGNVDHLKNIPNKGKSWAGKTANSKKLVDLHAAALEHASGKKGEAPTASADPQPEPKPKPKVALKKKPATEPDPAPTQALVSSHVAVADAKTGAMTPTLTKKVFNGDNPVWFSQSSASKIVFDGKAKVMGEGPSEFAKNRLAELKAAQAAGYTYTNYKVSGLQHAYVLEKDGQILTKQGMAELINGEGSKSDPDPSPAPSEPPPKTDEPKAAPSGHAQLDQIPWDGLKLPDSNKNAKSHNGKIDAIKKMAYDGDVAGLEAFKAGVNTYGKKQNKLAQTALAALKENEPAPETPPQAKVSDKQKHLNSVKTAASSSTAEMFASLHVAANDYSAEAHQEAAGALAANGYHEAAKHHADEAAAQGGQKEGKHGAFKADDGPKEGDTKEGANGTLIFKDGRWHKQGDSDPGAAERPAEIVPIPTWEGASDKQSDQLQKLAETLLANVKEQGKPALTGVMSKSPTKGKITIKVGGIHAKLPLEPQKPWAQNLVAFVEDVKANAKAIHEQASKSTAAVVDNVTPEPAAPVSPSAPEPMDHWEQTGGQGGSNPGGKFKDDNGVEWYCKFPGNEEHAKAEVLAANLYALTGVTGQDAKLITKDGKLGIASRWMDVKKANSPTALSKVDGVKSGFAVDAWLGNWDVVGLSFDNLQVGPDGKAARIDAGGSLMFRAQGGKKAFEDTVTELDSLRDASINPQSAKVFGKMTKADITASVAKVVNLTDAQIKGVVEQGQWGTPAERDALAETLIKRRDDLKAKYPKAAKMTPKKRLDPTKLPVDPDRLPKPHDFANWNGAGQGLSSQAHINEANNAVEQQAFEVAKKGNLNDLKSFTFKPIDKATGSATGDPVPIAQHPSKHVQQYHADLVTVLDEIANPPQPLKLFKEAEVGTLDELAAVFPPKPFGTTVNKVHSNEKLGFWVVLGGAQGSAEKFKPAKVSDFSKEAIDAAYTKFQEAKPLAKHFVKSVQASGSYNDLFRNGAEKDNQGNKLSDVAAAALEFATEQPEGTSVYRWQNMTDEMVKKVMSAPHGTVFQATGPMCTSYSSTGTAHFGKHRVTVRYAKGAKAVESFGSGSFSSEKEITTLPNSRFVVLSRKMVPDTEHGKPGSKRLELEVLMLPPDLGINATLSKNDG